MRPRSAACPSGFARRGRWRMPANPAPGGPSHLTIEHEPSHNGHVVLTAVLGDELVHQDKVEIARAADRDRFVADLCGGRPGIDADAVRQDLLRLAREHEAAKSRRADAA